MIARSYVILSSLLLSAVALLLAGAIFGFFYAYSVSVMRGLAAAGPKEAIAAMQGINATIRNALFAPAFFGAPVAAVAAGTALSFGGYRWASILMFVAGGTYILGAFIPTFAVNIPMNQELAGVDVATASEPEQIWAYFAARWTWWNHVRTAFSALALGLIGLALFLAGAQSRR